MIALWVSIALLAGIGIGLFLYKILFPRVPVGIYGNWDVTDVSLICDGTSFHVRGVIDTSGGTPSSIFAYVYDGNANPNQDFPPSGATPYNPANVIDSNNNLFLADVPHATDPDGNPRWVNIWVMGPYKRTGGAFSCQTAVYCHDFDNQLKGNFAYNGDGANVISFVEYPASSGKYVCQMAIDGSETNCDNGGLEYTATYPASVRFMAKCKIVSHTANSNKFIMVNFRKDSSSVSKVLEMQVYNGTTYVKLDGTPVQFDSVDTSELEDWFTIILDYTNANTTMSLALITSSGIHIGSKQLSSSHTIETVVFKPYSANSDADITVQWDDVCLLSLS